MILLKKGVWGVFIFFTIVLMGIPVEATTAAQATSPFHYTFKVNGILVEAANQDSSTSPYWWLNSGAKLILLDGTGKTIQNELPTNDPWRLTYLSSNPLDTDNGYHPQNIFRLFTRSKWTNFHEIVYFKIVKDQLSASPNRDAHNGVLLVSRYQNGNNLYYSGLRVDGNAIIKKKLNGRYYTFASKRIFPGTYNRLTNPDLLPKNIWMGIKSQITTINGKVNIKLFLDRNKTGNWELILEANDTGNQGSPIVNEGYAGIRTDFIDAEFDDFQIINV